MVTGTNTAGIAHDACTAGRDLAGAEDHRLAGVEVHGDGGVGHGEVLDAVVLQLGPQELLELAALDQPALEERQHVLVEEVVLGHLQGAQLGVHDPALVGVERADQAADGRADDDVDGDLLLLEDPQGADVREAAGAAAAERQADARPDLDSRRRLGHDGGGGAEPPQPASGGQVASRTAGRSTADHWRTAAHDDLADAVADR